MNYIPGQRVDTLKCARCGGAFARTEDDTPSVVLPGLALVMGAETLCTCETPQEEKADGYVMRVVGVEDDHG